MSNTARDQAIAQVRSICDMVAALHCDYDRLQELRDACADFVSDSPLSAEDAAYKWRADNPDDAAELVDLKEAAGDCESEEDARERITEDALSVEVRSGWHSAGETCEPEEFRIVLCTGGPHVELRGDLDRGEPSRVQVHYADWGTSGEYYPDASERKALEAYCRCFYFGE